MLDTARVVPDPIALAPAAPVAVAAWSVPKRVGFRFVFSFVLLWQVPFPIGMLPYTELVARPFELGWDALTAWCSRVVLHRAVELGPNGSGDTTTGWLQLALLIVLALLSTAIWSALDRRRASYAR